MSDMVPDSSQSITDLILAAPDQTWKKLKSALRVTTKDEAVAMVAQDEKAAALALSILSNKGKSLLTQQATVPEETMLTAPARRSGKAKVKF